MPKCTVLINQLSHHSLFGTSFIPSTNLTPKTYLLVKPMIFPKHRPIMDNASIKKGNKMPS